VNVCVCVRAREYVCRLGMRAGGRACVCVDVRVYVCCCYCFYAWWNFILDEYIVDCRQAAYRKYIGLFINFWLNHAYLCSSVFCWQECPTGIVNEDTFKEIYAQFFPQGGKRQTIGFYSAWSVLLSRRRAVASIWFEIWRIVDSAFKTGSRGS